MRLHLQFELLSSCNASSTFYIVSFIVSIPLLLERENLIVSLFRAMSMTKIFDKNISISCVQIRTRDPFHDGPYFFNDDR